MGGSCQQLIYCSRCQEGGQGVTNHPRYLLSWLATFRANPGGLSTQLLFSSKDGEQATLAAKWLALQATLLCLHQSIQAEIHSTNPLAVDLHDAGQVPSSCKSKQGTLLVPVNCVARWLHADQAHQRVHPVIGYLLGSRIGAPSRKPDIFQHLLDELVTERCCHSGL